MSFVIVNIDTGKAYGKKPYARDIYPTSRGAKGMCTRLNTTKGRDITGLELRVFTEQWKVIPSAEYNARPIKMVERINLMSGLPYMEAEDTPNFCSPASETYWSM